MRKGSVLSDWEETVCSLGRHLGNELGVAHSDRVEAWLQNVLIFNDGSTYCFESKADPSPGAFAAMEVMLLPPDMLCQLGTVALSMVKVPSDATPYAVCNCSIGLAS